MSEQYARDCEEAARLFHLSWCTDPHCVGLAFQADRDHVGPILRIAEPIYTERDALRAAGHHLLTLNTALRTELARLETLRSQIESHQAALGEMLGP